MVDSVYIADISILRKHSTSEACLVAGAEALKRRRPTCGTWDGGIGGDPCPKKLMSRRDLTADRLYLDR